MIHLRSYSSPYDIINIKMDDFINVIKKDPQLRNKIKDILDKYNKLSLNYQSKIGYDTLFQIVIFKELIKLMNFIKVDIDK